MANSRFDYHKKEEIALDRQFEPRFYVVIKLEHDIPQQFVASDGFYMKGLTRLVRNSAQQVMNKYRGHVTMAYCNLKDVHFIITPDSDLFTRRISKLVSIISVVFATYYDNNWFNCLNIASNQADNEIKDSNWSATTYEFGDLKQIYRYLFWIRIYAGEINGTVLEQPSDQNQLHEFEIGSSTDKNFWLDLNMFKCLDKPAIQDTVEDLNEYFKAYEIDNRLCFHKGCYIIVRVDGDKFHNYSSHHEFHKPNDKRALDLMVNAAKRVMNHFSGDIALAYGASDEFSFLIRYNAEILSRDIPKMLSVLATRFSNYYNQNWNQFFGKEADGKVTDQKCCALFDAKIRKYPDFVSVINYFKWRQADCHINNLYNTTLHTLTGFYQKHELIQTNHDKENNLSTDRLIDARCQTLKRTPIRDWIKDESQFLCSADATRRLKGTYSPDKQDILFKEFGINYNQELEQFKKGTVIVDTNASFALGDATFESRYKHYSVDITKHNNFWFDNCHIFDDFDRTLLE